MFNYIEISEFIGKTIKEIMGAYNGSEEIMFSFTDGTSYKMYHEQDCCEYVSVEDVSGEMEYIVGYPILSAEERSNKEDGEAGSHTWTYYSISTVRGYLDIRWYGSSNGCYSEGVSVVKQ